MTSGASHSPALVDAIDALLPQTQCTKCGHGGCRPYAEAIASGAPINRCPPGGEPGIRALASLLNRSIPSLDPECGIEQPLRVAVIDEAHCIGCTLCIQACPVDAIVGAPKKMHTVLASCCTGCDLCIPPCPVDCIAMIPAADSDWNAERRAAARARFESRNARLARDRKAGVQPTAATPAAPIDDKEAVVRAALERARARRAKSGPTKARQHP